MNNPLAKYDKKLQIIAVAFIVLVCLVWARTPLLGIIIDALRLPRNIVQEAIIILDGGKVQDTSGTVDEKAREAIQISLAAFSSVSLLISFVVERRSQTYRGFAKGVLEFNFRFYNSHFVFLLLVVALAEILCFKMIFGLSDGALQSFLVIHIILSLLLMCKTILFHQFGRNLDPVILAILKKRVSDRGQFLLMYGVSIDIPKAGNKKGGPGSLSPDSKADANNIERRLSALEIVKTLALDTGLNYDIVNQYDKIRNRYGDELLQSIDILLGGGNDKSADPSSRSSADSSAETDFESDYFTRISPYWWYIIFSQITQSLIRGVRTGPCSQAGSACIELLSWFAAEVAARLARLRDLQAIKFRELSILTAIHAAAIDGLSFRETMEFIRIFERKCADMIAAENQAPEQPDKSGQALSANSAGSKPVTVPGLRQLLNRLYTSLYCRGYYLEANTLSEEISRKHDALYSALSAITTIAYDRDFTEDQCYLWQIWSTLDEMPPSACYASLPDVRSLRKPVIIEGPKTRVCFRELYDLGKITR